MKDYIIIGLIIVITLLILFRRVSGMSPAPSSNCGSKMINKDLKCSDIYPGVYERDGAMEGNRKFCCA
jgi:hypothetical protein